MVESQLLQEWTAAALRDTELKTMRTILLRLLNGRFFIPVPPELTQVINAQDSQEVLGHWFDAALHAASLDEFTAVLRR